MVQNGFQDGENLVILRPGVPASALPSLPVSYILLIFLINFLAAPWLERPRRRNSLYAVTNRRQITIIKPNTLFITETVRTYPIRKLKYVHQKLHKNGTGHLIPGNSLLRTYRNPEKLRTC